MDKEQKAARAKAILDDELYNQAFNDIKTRLLNEWETTSKDTAEREIIYFKIQALNDIQQEMKTHINNNLVYEGTFLSALDQ